MNGLSHQFLTCVNCGAVSPQHVSVFLAPFNSNSSLVQHAAAYLIFGLPPPCPAGGACRSLTSTLQSSALAGMSWCTSSLTSSAGGGPSIIPNVYPPSGIDGDDKNVIWYMLNVPLPARNGCMTFVWTVVISPDAGVYAWSSELPAIWLVGGSDGSKFVSSNVSCSNTPPMSGGELGLNTLYVTVTGSPWNIVLGLAMHDLITSSSSLLPTVICPSSFSSDWMLNGCAPSSAVAVWKCSVLVPIFFV